MISLPRCERRPTTMTPPLHLLPACERQKLCLLRLQLSLTRVLAEQHPARQLDRMVRDRLRFCVLFLQHDGLLPLRPRQRGGPPDDLLDAVMRRHPDGTYELRLPAEFLEHVV